MRDGEEIKRRGVGGNGGVSKSLIRSLPYRARPLPNHSSQISRPGLARLGDNTPVETPLETVSAPLATRRIVRKPN